MKRRIVVAMSVFAAFSGLAATTQPVSADEYYIPRGHAYGPGMEVLPPLNSEQDRINAMADIREAEIQRRLREERMFQEQFNLWVDLNLTRPGRPYSPY